MGELTQTNAAVNKNLVRSRNEQDAGQDQLSKYLTFYLSDSVYGVAIDSVKEIIEFGGITDVPMTPDYIRGVINLRGRVVPVIDLGARFRKEVKEVTKRTCIIIVEMTVDNEPSDIGFVVDLVNEVIDIASESIEPAPSFGADIRVDFIAGMARLEKGFTVLLDLENVLSVEELSNLTSAEAEDSTKAASLKRC